MPGVVDYTDEANAAFERFAAAGMHVVRSTEPIEELARGRRSAGFELEARAQRGLGDLDLLRRRLASSR